MTANASTEPIAPIRVTQWGSLRVAVIGVCALALGWSIIRDWITVVCYLVFVGGFQALLLAGVGIVLAVIKLSRPRFPLAKAAAAFVLFNLWFLFFGLAGDFAWEVTAPGKLYINHDPVVEWIPFVIPGNWTIDPVCHGSLTAGTTWTEMYLVWFSIALPVWTLTILNYRWTKTWVFRQILNRSFMIIVTALVALAITLGIIAFFRMGFA